MDQNIIIAPQTIVVEVVKNQACSLMNSLNMLNYYHKYSGMDAWLPDTDHALTPERKQLNEVVIEGLWGVTRYRGGTTSFLEHIARIEAQDPIDLRNQALGTLTKIFEKAGQEQPEDLLTSKEKFVNSLYGCYIEFYKSKHTDDEKAHLEEDVMKGYSDVYSLLLDPDQLKATAVEHLSWMWDNFLKDEWARVEPMIDESVAAFSRYDYNGLSPLEAMRAITGRDMRGNWDEMIEKFDHFEFVASPHISPYVSFFAYEEENLARVMFGARLPEGAKKADSPALSRSELLVRLNALADDNRLRIIELIINKGEMCAQDIITDLAFSQSAASRHLRQLSATGYLTERTKHGAKCYTLNTDRVDQTLKALGDFFAS